MHLEKLTQMELIKHVLVTPSRQFHVTLKKFYNFLSARTMISKFKQNIYEVPQLPITKLYDPWVTMFYGVTWQTKTFIYPLSWQLGIMMISIHKFAWSFDQVVLQDHAPNLSYHISTMKISKLAEWWFIMKEFNPESCMTRCSHGLARSHDKLKPLNLHSHNVYGYQTW